MSEDANDSKPRSGHARGAAPQPVSEEAAAFEKRLDLWIRGLPPAPVIPLEALRRENLYD
jgi:hypothetical protein